MKLATFHELGDFLGDGCVPQDLKVQYFNKEQLEDGYIELQTNDIQFVQKAIQKNHKVSRYSSKNLE